jgi:hypothetical protein
MIVQSYGGAMIQYEGALIHNGGAMVQYEVAMIHYEG